MIKGNTTIRRENIKKIIADNCRRITTGKATIYFDGGMVHRNIFTKGDYEYSMYCSSTGEYFVKELRRPGINIYASRSIIYSDLNKLQEQGYIRRKKGDIEVMNKLLEEYRVNC
ncbi:hypothetical protein [Vallitalea maricola]|uniref:Uncharacterized protein n=1 Tax=Vallitalea maricola TaxID=3074433 RepID=A0ACB5UNH6_9FIRM|nr:hypothetical protein AN2V17_34140 [Vallitalea sp. AN17-2]